MSISRLNIEIDKIDKNGWNYLMTQFDDASIYQTWSYGTSAKRNVSHIVIKDGVNILGCCQIILKRSPFYKIGIADIQWGPLCVKKGSIFNPDVLFNIIRGIKEEYAIKRGYFLRLWPHAKNDRKELLKQILESEGFVRNPLPRPYRTFILDLSSPIETLRKNFLQKWRNCLNRAEKHEFRVVEGTTDELYLIFLKLLDQMVERKKFEMLVNHQEYFNIQKDLPEPLKMKIMICEVSYEPVAAVVCSAIGDTGIYLFGATGQKGLNLNGSYLLQWRMIQWLKQKGIRYYDLGAFNPELNPSVYHFKKGIAGKNGREEIFLGEYQGCFNLTGKISKTLLNLSQLTHSIINKKIKI